MNEWKWSNQGVDIQGDRLLWYEDLGPVTYAGGGAKTQSFKEFLQSGPSVGGVPPDIVAAVEQAVRERLGASAGLPPAEIAGEGPDFDTLSRVANAPDGSLDDKSALYAAAFRLKDWLFIARGELPDVQPYLAANQSLVDGAPMLKAFTDSRRLHAFARENSLTDQDGGVQILALPVKSILPTMADFADRGVTHIHFNADQASDGFYSPLAQLAPIRQYLVNHGHL